MNKYYRLIQELETKGQGTMKCFVNSMLPKLSNPNINKYQKLNSYRIGDIVFCKVKGRFIDAHLIVKIAYDGQYMIANNHGWEIDGLKPSTAR